VLTCLKWQLDTADGTPATDNGVRENPEIKTDWKEAQNEADQKNRRPNVQDNLNEND